MAYEGALEKVKEGRKEGRKLERKKERKKRKKVLGNNLPPFPVPPNSHNPGNYLKVQRTCESKGVECISFSGFCRDECANECRCRIRARKEIEQCEASGFI
jgi:hypothetical protein